MDRRLLLGDPTAVDQALHEGVVGADLGEDTVAEQVNAGVADVGDGDLVADPQDTADRGSHAGQFRMLEHRLGQQRVRGDQGRLQGELGIVR